jgi:N-hydroxyarylamine O-acetyltransferase
MILCLKSVKVETQDRSRSKSLDIHDYLKRINYQGSLEPTLQTLQALHETHLLAVPFENLSIHSRQPIILQEEALFDKIVHQRRGGFCYELNGLFAWLLRQLGFQVTLLSARVSNAAGTFGPEFDHLTLLIHQLSGVDWLADVGFGDSFRLPLRFEAELEQEERGRRAYRLQRQQAEGDGKKKWDRWILQQFNDAQWEAQYCFTLQPHELADFTEMCSYHQTSPASHFTQKRICSLATPTGRISLSDLRLIVTTDQERREQVLANEEEYTATLVKYFGIVL